ncbi:MAG: YihA family ribosome biogenesis GTP-binding protein [Flavobacteriales bacterium]|nr:YihA family ribosome biogenesis GTP-binding protein [Bacteroidales bacterium AH-315-I05]PCJ89037.1 MAG: YihA family ribosome biogenesis GTP-binding protein [Flavobacteriales bacterium]
MLIKSAKFIISNVKAENCPKPIFPEYAFIGRSNVGKSSLINSITNRKKLAKTSRTPGKTQLINHFLINEQWYLVDLPGYGYAKRAKTERKKWQQFITNYFLKRQNMLCAFVLLDSRLSPQKIDFEFMEWLGENRIPFNMVFTKTDKLSSIQLDKNLSDYTNKMLEKWESLPPVFKTSAVNKLGIEEILGFIEETNRLPLPH